MRHLPIVVLAAALGAAGCSKQATSVVAVPAGPPAASTSTGVVNRLLWCLQERDSAHYRDVFAGDFQFVYAALDSAGQPVRPTPWGRPDSLPTVVRMFAGGDSIPPGTDVLVAFVGTPVAQPDPRPGRSPRAHQVVSASVRLTFQGVIGGVPGLVTRTGYATFFAVRGDSADIPPDQVAAGASPDSGRWWLQQWDAQAAGAPGRPAR